MGRPPIKSAAGVADIFKYFFYIVYPHTAMFASLACCCAQDTGGASDKVVHTKVKSIGLALNELETEAEQPAATADGEPLEPPLEQPADRKEEPVQATVEEERATPPANCEEGRATPPATSEEKKESGH